MGFTNNIPLIQPGDPVASALVNRSLSALSNDANYLWSILQTIQAGQSLFIRGVLVEAAVVVGTPVYYNGVTQRFERALARAEVNDAGAMVVSESARSWGVVYSKASSTTADILVFGVAQLDISAALDTGVTLAAGTYYLSRGTAGKLTTTPGPVAVTILKADGEGGVFVAPRWSDLLSGHTHLHFKLKPWPAGTHSTPIGEGRHVITDPDMYVEGWLPADHASFNGHAPTGAAFGYNISANAALAAVWPPLPPEHASLAKDGVLVPSGTDGLVVFDAHGIWWMSDCYADSPFPPTITTTTENVSEYSETPAISESVDVCPFPYNMQLDLYFTLPDYLDSATVVTSLTSADPRLTVTCADNPSSASSVGALVLGLNLAFLSADNAPDGALAVKAFDAATQTLQRGRIMAGLYSLNSNVQLTGANTATVTISGRPRTVYYGDVGVNIVTTLNRELDVELVRLDGVEERYQDDVMFLCFPTAEETSIRGRISVPEVLDITGTPQMQLKFRMLGTTAGTIPALTLSYRRIPKSDAAVALPSSDTALPPLASNTVNANYYLDVESYPFTVAAGDDVLFTLTRVSGGDTYAGDVGILRQAGIVTST